MAVHISVAAQKGGVGKSALVRTLAVIFTIGGWEVKIADLDTKQTTCLTWNIRRNKNQHAPQIAVQQYTSVKRAIKDAENIDMMIFDSPPHSADITLEMAKNSSLMLIPTKTSFDDLDPNIILANDLKKKGIKKSKIAFIFSRINRGGGEIKKAMDYVRRAGYFVFDDFIPDRAGYEDALDLGLALTEAKNIHSRSKAKKVMQDIVNYIDTITEEEES